MFIFQIVIILLATKIAGQISVRLGQPSVLGKILVGIILGPALLGWIQETEILTVFSQIGVLLLMFLAGLIVAGMIAGIFFSDKFKLTQEDLTITNMNGVIKDKNVSMALPW